MKFAVLALTLLLAVASQAASVPAEEPSEIQMRFTAFKGMVHQLKTILDNAIARTEGSQHLQSPSMISQGLEGFHALLTNHEDSIVASLDAGHEIFSQMIGAGELTGQLDSAVAHLDTVFRGHLAEYNTLLKPIVADFKQHSLRFREEVAPKVANLRTEFRSNLNETLTALGPVMNTVMKMVTNFRDSANMYVEEYRRNMEDFYKQIESMTPEERERRKAEMELIGQEIVAKFQKLYDVASGSSSQN